MIKRNYGIVKPPPPPKFTKTQVLETVFSKILDFHDDKSLKLDSNFAIECGLDEWTR